MICFRTSTTNTPLSITPGTCLLRTLVMKVYTKTYLPAPKPLTSSFHHSRPWLLIALAEGIIELWDYRCNVRLYSWNAHKSTIRCIHFHPSRQICASASDDGDIKIWNVGDSRATLQGVLKGHRDTVRTAFFHTTEPWLISASDDQSVKIWNWQSQTEISCLLAHGDYVLCANFHPSRCLAVSASIDKTAYLWDLTYLQQRNGKVRADQDGTHKGNFLNSNPFSDAQPIAELVGHTAAVNWVAFHSKRNLIVSCADDKLVKTWKYTDDSATLDRTFTGHSAPVICAVFHPTQELILSTGRDRKLLIDDPMDPTFTKKYTREGTRLWHMSALSEDNLVSVVGDAGVVLLKFNKDRPCHCVVGDKLVLINKMDQVQIQSPGNPLSLPYISLKSLNEKGRIMHQIAFNDTNYSILVNPGRGKIFLIDLPRTPTGAVKINNYHSFSGHLAAFVSDEVLIIYDKDTHRLLVTSIDGQNISSINVSPDIKPRILKIINNNRVLILSKRSLLCINIETGNTKIYEDLSHAKNIQISKDEQFIAVTCQLGIHILSNNLDYVTSIISEVKIKSAQWDDSNTLFYSTPNHIRFMLVNGDSGIIKSTNELNYLLRIEEDHFWYLDKFMRTGYSRLNISECIFKKALINKDTAKINHYIKNSNLVGRNIVRYTSSAGYPDVAAKFTSDPFERFDFFIKSNNISMAYKVALNINDHATWRALSTYAIKLGNIEIAQEAYRKMKDIDKLSFISLLADDKQTLDHLRDQTIESIDIQRSFTNAIYCNDVSRRSKIFYDSKSYALAYLTAKSHNDIDMMNKCLESAHLTEHDIIYPS